MADGVASNVDESGEVVHNKHHERKQLSKTGAKENGSYQKMSDVWKLRYSSSGSPQGQGSDEQLRTESFEGLPKMPQGNTCGGWGLGTWKDAIEKGEVQDMREILYSDALSRDQKEFLVWIGAMYGREWTKECFQALGQSSQSAAGVKNRADRLKAIGNGQVPAVVVLAWQILSARLKQRLGV